MPLHYGTSAAEADRAGLELVNPFKAGDAAAEARGAEVYQAFCKVCHGASGSGDGVVPRRGYPPPPSFLAGAPALLRDGRIFHAITYGKGNMPSYAAQVAREDRWKAVLYVRSLQKQAAADAAAAQAAARAAAKKAAPKNAAVKPAEATATEKPVAGKALMKKASEKAR